MDEMLIKILVCFAMFSMIGWFILFAGISTRREKRQRDMLERTHTSGIVVDHVKKEKSAGKSGVTNASLPLIEFKVFEQKCRYEYNHPLDQKRWPPGSTVEVWYDGNNPAHFHLEEDFTYTNGGRNAIRVGVYWILFSAAATLALAVIVGGMSLDEVRWRIRRFFRIL